MIDDDTVARSGRFHPAPAHKIPCHGHRFFRTAVTTLWISPQESGIDLVAPDSNLREDGASRRAWAEEEIAESPVIGRHLWGGASMKDDLNAVQHGIPPLEARNFEALAASLKAISAVLLPGTGRQRELEKAIAWEKQRRAEAEVRAQLRAQEERRSFVAMIDRLDRGDGRDGVAVPRIGTAAFRRS
jgi:hypothetical protein